MDENKKIEINDEDLAQVTGGAYDRDAAARYEGNCHHPGSYVNKHGGGFADYDASCTHCTHWKGAEGPCDLD